MAWSVTVVPYEGNRNLEAAVAAAGYHRELALVIAYCAPPPNEGLAPRHRHLDDIGQLVMEACRSPGFLVDDLAELLKRRPTDPDKLIFATRRGPIGLRNSGR